MLFPLALLLFGCGIKIKYTDRKDFIAENETERKELYKEVLSSVGVDTADKFSLMYIDYIMTESERFKTLEKLNPTDNFSAFFLDAIPILYYSYSPMNYKAVPKEWKEKTTKYILEQNIYPFNNGEKKFRKWLEKQLKDEKWYLFSFYSEDEPELRAKGDFDNESFQNLIATFAWGDDYNFADFKELNKSSQATLIAMQARFNYLDNGNKVDDDARKAFDNIAKRWENRAAEFLSNSRFAELSDDASIKQVTKIALNLVIGSF